MTCKVVVLLPALVGVNLTVTVVEPLGGTLIGVDPPDTIANIEASLPVIEILEIFNVSVPEFEIVSV